MLLLAVLAFQRAQFPDTTGVRQAVATAISAAWRREILRHAPFTKAPHIFVDHQAFKESAGIDTTASVDWSSLARALGSHGTADSNLTCGGNECPWVDGEIHPRTGNTLTIVIEFHHPETAHGNRAVGWSPWRVRLTRQNGIWKVKNVAWIED